MFLIIEFFRVLLKSVVEELDNYEYPFLHSLALQLYGSWIEETKSEPASDVIRKYFQKVKDKYFRNFIYKIYYYYVYVTS